MFRVFEINYAKLIHHVPGLLKLTDLASHELNFSRCNKHFQI